ncbi:IS21 family transposase [Candidatus Clostridium stratigraminis]|uniref:IS21 family transposase n=1 Tax=Candidatus Clostridium stratigraminis TaxID=3381661 RepID=A0ABW8T885_9CLOT
MLKVSQQEYIKYLREFEGLNISEIKERLDVNWRTAKKYADKDDWNEPVMKTERKSPVMDSYKEIVDTWLSEDRLVPRKQRHTSKAIFNRLVNELGFSGGYRTVCTYVEKRKKAMKLEEAKAYEKLEHPAGEAQVDFYTMKVSKESELVDRKVLVLSYPNSNAAFVHPVPSENQECFLEALKRLFEKSCGVPHTIWFDNLSAAVAHINKNGERTLTDSFLKFRAHYGFKSVFCNPASGNEKGNVENKCGYTRRNFCVPIPILESLEKLEEELDERSSLDMERPHYQKGKTIKELWEEEKKSLKNLPLKSYEVYRLDSMLVNNYGEVKIDKMPITVFGAKPGTYLPVKIMWDKIEVLDNEYNLLTSVPRAYTDKVQEVPWVEVFKGYCRKPRSVTHSQFAKMLPRELYEYICIDDIADRKDRITACLNWIAVYSVKDINEALIKAKDNLCVSVITAVLHSMNGHTTSYKREVAENYTPEEIRKAPPNLDKYNQLSRAGV